MIIRSVNLKKGTYIKFQPHKTAFIDNDVKPMLEQELKNFTCLHKGDTIQVTHAGTKYMVNVTECKPDDAICVIETDLKTDFEAPLDYVEPKRPEQV